MVRTLIIVVVLLLLRLLKDLRPSRGPFRDSDLARGIVRMQ
jgi:hypothetical protein